MGFGGTQTIRPGIPLPDKAASVSFSIPSVSDVRFDDEARYDFPLFTCACSVMSLSGWYALRKLNFMSTLA